VQLESLVDAQKLCLDAVTSDDAGLMLDLLEPLRGRRDVHGSGLDESGGEAGFGLQAPEDF